MDYCVGCGWWIMILYLLEIGALFMVRGRPYSGETVVATLFSQANHHLQVWMAPMLSFDWNIVVPVALIVSVVEHYNILYYFIKMCCY
jgi:solute carrier family 6 (neurotransmitter transporter), invertebrate